jgi:CheY-like chemotaxis protein
VADAPSRQVVLIVEDEALVRMTAVGMIEEARFEVLEATNADEAILLLEARRDITVVFTDIEMPGDPAGTPLKGNGCPADRRVAAGFSTPAIGSGRNCSKPNL